MKDTKHTYPIWICIIVTAALLFSCSNEKIEEISFDKDVVKAKAWYDTQVKGNTVFTFRGNDYQLWPAWDHAKTYKNDSMRVVEVPLFSNRDLEKSEKLDGVPYYFKLTKEVSDEAYFKLVVITDNNNNINGYNMLTSSNIEKGISIATNTYLKPAKHLNAYIALFDLKSNFIRGHEYVHGELINNILPINNIKASSSSLDYQYTKVNGICYKLAKSAVSLSSWLLIPPANVSQFETDGYKCSGVGYQSMSWPGGHSSGGGSSTGGSKDEFKEPYTGTSSEYKLIDGNCYKIVYTYDEGIIIAEERHKMAPIYCDGNNHGTNTPWSTDTNEEPLQPNKKGSGIAP